MVIPRVVVDKFNLGPHRHNAYSGYELHFFLCNGGGSGQRNFGRAFGLGYQHHHGVLGGLAFTVYYRHAQAACSGQACGA